MKVKMVLLAVLLIQMQLAFTQVSKIKATEIERVMKESRHPLIVSFWATFCKPCMEEMPYLLKQAALHKQDSVELILVSLDLEEAFPAKINAFIKSRKIQSRVVWLDEFNADYFCPKIDSSWTGSIPTTLFLNNKTGYRKLVEEQMPEKRVEAELKAALN